MAFRDNTRFKRNKGEDEERQYDTVFSSHKTTSRFRKSYNDAKRDGGLNTEDRERKISPYTHHESYNPYDMALETARNSTQPTTNNVTSANFYDDLTDKDKINLSESKYDLGVVPQALLQFPGGYSIPTMEALTPKKENLLSQREGLWNQETDKINDFYNNVSNIGQNEVKNPSEIDMDSFVNNVSNIGQSENKELDVDAWKEFVNNSGNQKDNGNWYEQLKDVDKTLDTVNYYEDLNKYYSIPEAEDFEEYSKYTGASAFPTSEAQKVAKALNDGSFNAPLSEYKFATDDEVAVFNYLLNKEGEEAAMDFYNKLNLTGRRTQEYTNNVKEFLTRDDGALLNTGKRTLGGLLSIPLGIVGGAVGTTANVGSYLTGNDIDINSDSNLATNIANAMRKGSITGTVNDLDNWGVSEGISDFLNSAGQSLAASYGIQNKSALGAVTGNNDVADELIDASKGMEFTTPEGVSQKIGEGLDLLYSTVNSALNIVFAGNAATITMGLSAANDTIIDAKERGLTDGQAIALGTLAGAIEVATEKYSVEALLDGDVRGWQAIKQNFLTEASEEGASAFLNEAIDLAISGDKAQRRVLYKQYLKEGYSENEALAMTLGSTLMDIMKQSAAGGISGALMSGGMEAYRYINESSTGNKMLSNEEGINTFVNLGLQSENEQTRELAQSVADGNKKKNIIGQLVQAVSSENNVVGNIVDKLIDSGETVAMAEAEAKAIMKEFYKEDLTAKEREYINKENVQNVLNDLYSGTYDELNEKSVTADDAYSRALELAKQNKKNPVANVVNTVKGVFNKNATETTENATETENNSQNEENNSQNEKSEEDNIRDAIRHMPLSQKGKAIAEADAYNKSIKQVNATLDDIKSAIVTDDGLRVSLGNGEVVSSSQIENGVVRDLLMNAEKMINDSEAVNQFVRDYNANNNVSVYSYSKAAEIMINNARMGVSEDQAVAKLRESADFLIDSGKIPMSMLHNMYNYGIKLQKEVSAAMNSETNREVTKLIREALTGIKIKEGDIKEQGSYNPATNEITLGKDTNQSQIETITHEGTHLIKEHAPEVYKELEDVVLTSFKENGTYQKFYDHVKKLYGENASEELIHEEMVARAMQEMLFNEDVIMDICKNKPHLGRRIWNAIKKAIAELQNVFGATERGTAESRALAEDIAALEKAKKLYAKGLKEATSIKVEETTKSETQTKYAIKDLSGVTDEAIQNNIDTVVNMDAVGTVQGKSNRMPTNQAKEELRNVLNNHKELKNDVVGIISDSLRYMFKKGHESQNYAKFLTLIPDVIEKGKVVDYQPQHKTYNYGTVVIAAPVDEITANGVEHYLMGVAIQIDTDANRLYNERYVKDFDVIKKSSVTTPSTTSLNNQIHHRSASGADDSIKNILKRIRDVKQNMDNAVKDSQGNKLSEGQQKYFEDSVVRNEEGNLLVVYHGTPSGGFTVFKNDLNFFTANKTYADVYQDTNASARKSGKTATNPMTYEGYLNITKPFDLSDHECMKVFIDEYIKGGWALGINPYQSDAEIKKQIKDGIDWTEADNLKEFFDEEGYDYDGIILNEGGYLDNNGNVVDRGLSYVTFNSNQFKNIDNLKPTKSPDIRYSKKDNHGRQLSEEQIEYFKDSKVRDAEGNLQVLYHQTDNDFTIFDTRKAGAGQHDYLTPYGVFLKPNSNNIGLKGNKQMELYANITNMLNVSSRYELENYLKKDADLKKAIDSMKTIDAEYQAKFDEAKNAWSNYIVENSKQGKDLRNDPELERLMDEEEKIVEAWGKEYDKRAEKVKANVDEYLRSQGYDGVHILKDEGSFGRKVETFIAFEPNQVKDVNNLNPTKNEDIRYSIKDNNGRLLSEGQIEYFKDSKVRDEQGRLIELYHGTGAEFTIFDLNEARDTEDIEAFFFSGNKEEAEGYGNIRKFYLNLKNPADYDTAYDIFFSFKRQAGAGAKTREELIKRGYDGVIAYDEDSPEYTEYLAFYPEQIKLTSNLNPTENEDIRYSLQDDWDFDWESAMAESEEEKIAEGMVAQNDVNILEDGFRALKDIKDAGKVNISHNKAVQIAKRYTEKYDSATGAESLATSIEAVFAYIREHDVSYDDMLRVMRDVTLPVVENIRGDEQFTEEYRDFVKSLKGTSISLNESQKKEVAYAYGSMANFRKAVAGRFNIKEDGVNIDSLWPEIVEQSGYRLDEEENSNSQAIALLELLDQMKSDKGTVNRGMSDNQLALDMALNIYTDCFKEMSMNAAKVNETEVAKRLAETKEILKDTVAKYEDAVDKMYKQMLADTKARAQAEIDRLKAEINFLNNVEEHEKGIETEARIQQLRRQLEKLKEKQAQDVVNRKSSRLKAAQNRENSKTRNAIKRIVKDLSSRLANPNNNRYIPKNLVKATIDLLESIDFDTKEGREISEKVAKVKNAYENILNDENNASDYDPTLYEMIKRLNNIFEGKTIKKLTKAELEDVLTIAKAIQTQVKNANEFVKSEMKQKIDEAAKGVIEDVNANKKVSKNKILRYLDKFANNSLNAERFFRRLINYKDDSSMMKLYDELNEGTHKQLQIQKEVTDMFKDNLKDDKQARWLTGENSKDWVETPFKDSEGNTVKIPAGMRVSLAMHLLNEDNLKHIIYGGLTIPDIKMYNEGDKEDAYSSPAAEIRLIDNKQMSELYKLRDKINEYTGDNAEQYTNQEREDAWEEFKNKKTSLEAEAKAKLQSFVDEMTQYEIDFFENAKKYFHEYSGQKINETSMALNGYPKATVENYFPIATDKNYRQRNIEGLKLDQTLEGWGNLKSRVGAKNPIYLENIVDVLNSHSDMVAKYAGLAIPIRNFNRVYNFNLDGYTDSVQHAINTRRGKSATDYIDNILTDLQGSRGVKNNFLGFIRGSLASATLTANQGVTTQQAASFPTAAATLGWDPILHTLGTKEGLNLVWTILNPLHTMTKYTKNRIEYINQITPLLWNRNRGNFTQELGDLKKQQTLWDKNKYTKKAKETAFSWITNVDVTTVAAIEAAVEYKVLKETNLKKGTPEFKEAVRKLYEATIEQTQPNYTVLQRTGISRSPSETAKILSMYKTQPFQNLGILVDAVGNYSAKIEEFRSNPTKENKAKLEKAGYKYRLGVSAVVISTLVLGLFRLFGKALTHKMDRYRDENGELTISSISEVMLKDFISAMAGMVAGGSELYEWVNAKVTDDRYYGIESSAVGAISDLAKDLQYLDFSDDFDTVMKNSKKVIFDASNLAGIPLRNLTDNFMALARHVEDFANGEPFSFDAGYQRTNKQNATLLYNALESEDQDEFDKVYNRMLGEGYSEEDFYNKQGDNNDAADIVTKKYKEGDIDFDTAVKYYTELGMNEDDAYFKTVKMTTDFQSPYALCVSAISSEDTEAIIDAVNGMLDHGYTKDKLKGYDMPDSIKEQYIDLYHTNKTEAASLKSAILTYYQACGMSREDAAKKVDKWVE